MNKFINLTFRQVFGEVFVYFCVIGIRKSKTYIKSISSRASHVGSSQEIATVKKFRDGTLTLMQRNLRKMTSLSHASLCEIQANV